MAVNTNVLTTLATVKTDLGISGSTYDTELERAINAASDYIENYCNRVFYRDTAIEEDIEGFGYTRLLVSRAPINSITSIEYADSALDSDTYEIYDASAGIIHKNGGWIWTANQMGDISQGPLPGTERKRYTVTYDGGWYTPNQYDLDNSNTRALPWDIEEACIELVRLWYQGKKLNKNVKKERLLNWSAEYSGLATGSIGVPSSILTVLNKYRRIANG